MTRMVPPTIHSSVTSAAERRIFKQIQNAAGTDSWVCLHSLGLAKHAHKRRAEIDFLVICPDGLFVLEVKGGRVSCNDGVWIHTDRYGESTRKHEGPFDQASSAMFALEKDLKRALKNIRISDLLFGYGVLFPDIEYSTVGCQEDPALVYDARDLRSPFRDYIIRLEQFTRARQPKRRQGLDLKQIQAITDSLRGDFDLQPIPELELDEARRSISDLTGEQRAILDSAETAARLLVDGPAGSGKTILAMEAARREARKGRRVLFLCFNRFLAVKIRGELRVESYSGRIDVKTLASYCLALVEASTLLEQFNIEAEGAENQDLYKKLLPEYAALASMERANAPYDCLVIDEAQDILSDGLADLLSEEVLDGLELGRWRIFLDSNNQASIYGVLEDRELERFELAADKRANLTLNCRNTKQIEFQTNIVAEPKNRAPALVAGPAVDYRTFKSDAQCLSQVKTTVAELRTEGIAPGRISFLFVHRPNHDLERKLKEFGLRKLDEADLRDLGTASLKELTWSTVSAYKGLENDIIVLVGVNDIEKSWSRGVTYVGMSRARVRLIVIVHSKCDVLRQRRFEREMARRVNVEEMIT